MKKIQRVRDAIAKHPPVFIVLSALLIAASFMLMQSVDVMPLEGDAAHLYGPLPTPRVVIRSSSSSSARSSVHAVLPLHQAARHSSSRSSLSAVHHL